MAGGGEAAAEARRLHPRWWPVRWEGKITQAPQPCPRSTLLSTIMAMFRAMWKKQRSSVGSRKPVPGHFF